MQTIPLDYSNSKRSYLQYFKIFNELNAKIGIRIVMDSAGLPHVSVEFLVYFMLPGVDPHDVNG